MNDSHAIELPNGWAIARVGEVCTDIKYGYTASASEDRCGPRFLRITDIQNGQVQWESVPYCPMGAEQIPKYALSVGDIVFARTGGTVGKSFLITSVPEECVFASYLIRLSVRAEISPKFLYYFFQSGAYWEQIGIKKGGLQGNVNATALSLLEVPICPINEQARIVARIEELFSELDNGIESLQTSRQQLKVYCQALLNHAFEGKLTAHWRAENRRRIETADQFVTGAEKRGRARARPGTKLVETIPEKDLESFPVLPAGWTYSRLGVFIEDIQAGKSFKCDEREPHDDEVGVAKVSAVTWGEYDEKESKTCIDLDKINPSLLIREGDFLFSRANTIGLVGACVIVGTTRKKIMLSDKTLRVICSSGVKEYLLHYLRSRAGRNEIMKRSTGNQDSMRNIGQHRIRSIIVPACSRAEMAEIAKALSEHFTRMQSLDTAIQQEVARSESLRLSILKSAFSGKLVAQDSNDESASFLLMRIRSEKAEIENGKKRIKRRAAA